MTSCAGNRPAAGCILLLAVLTSACAPEREPAGAIDCGLDDAQIGSFVTLPAGEFARQGHPGYPEEGYASPQHFHVAAFELQLHEVTNDQFAAFVAATDYVTDAERSAASGKPGGGSGFFAGVVPDGMGGWSIRADANWRSPQGSDSNLADRGRYPVVHVSRRDAAAYAAWAGGRLPTETEWEYAAITGLPDPERQDSGAYTRDGTPVANTWQGVFPFQDDGTDGFRGAAPVGCYPPSRVGLHDMIGNVWEWTSTPYRQYGAVNQDTLKGGSFLCADNYCMRYRPTARQGQDVDFSTNHIGFRIARDLPESVAADGETIAAQD